MSTIGDALVRKNNQLPQYEYLFRVELPNIYSTGLQPGTLAQSPETAMTQNIFTTDLNHRVYSVDAPYVEYESGKHTLGDSFWYSASNSDIGAVNMRIDEYEDGKTLEYLLAWQRMLGDSLGRNPPAVYKGNIKIVRLSSSLEDIHVHNYLGYFPTQISPSSYSYESNGTMQYSVAFTGDDVEHIIVPTRAVMVDILGEQGIMGKISEIMEKIPSSVSAIFDAVVGVDTSALRSYQKTPFSIRGTSTNVAGTDLGQVGTIVGGGIGGGIAGIGGTSGIAGISGIGGTSRGGTSGGGIGGTSTLGTLNSGTGATSGTVDTVSLTKQGNPFRGL